MRAMVNIKPEIPYTSEIDGVMALWEDKENRKSMLVLFGRFPKHENEEIRFHETFVIHFKTETAFSLVKKFEKEEVADLTTAYIKSLVDTQGIEKFNNF